ncbi:MAG: endonuclease/exonuclease/phosphatase family protein, partial [Gammaproteobacteria bacterium]
MNFRVASFNLLNLVRPGVRYYDLPPHTEDEHERKIKWIAQTLDRSQADIVGFQEVFSGNSLQSAVSLSQHFPDDAQVLSPGAG